MCWLCGVEVGILNLIFYDLKKRKNGKEGKNILK